MADEEKGDDNTVTNGDVNGDPTVKEIEVQDENEYSAINCELDNLDNCLDTLENWNDSLSSRMKECLDNMQKSRQANEESKTKELPEDNTEVDK
ncbi:hypothetical protein QZH41_016936 [Actinostola sp. cb2023]|nr:hypothetical protein QZH41_016936 [Actinostola sp. cb2023]